MGKSHLWKLMFILYFVLLPITGCTSPSASKFHFEGDGNKLLIKGDELPTGWKIDYFNDISSVKNASQLKINYRMADLPQNIAPNRYIGTGVTIFENEKEAASYWDFFYVFMEDASQGPCFTPADKYDYASNLADQFAVWCLSAGKLTGRLGYQHAVTTRYGNVVSTLSAVVVLDEDVTEQEAIELGVLRWSEWEKLLQLTDEKFRQAMEAQQ